MWRDALLVAGKDLRIEARSRVALWQVLPFALLVLVLFAFALGSRAVGPQGGRAGPLLAGRALLDGARDAAELRHRVRRGHPGRPPALGYRPGRHLPRQGRGGGPAARGPAGRPVGGRDAVLRRPGPRRLAGRRGVAAGHHRAGRGRGHLRRALGRAPGPRDAAATARPADPRPGAARRLPSVGGRDQRLGGDRRAVAARSSGPFAAVYVVVGIVLYGPLQEAG